jgi:hypothetical protein
MREYTRLRLHVAHFPNHLPVAGSIISSLVSNFPRKTCPRQSVVGFSTLNILLRKYSNTNVSISVAFGWNVRKYQQERKKKCSTSTRYVKWDNRKTFVAVYFYLGIYDIYSLLPLSRMTSVFEPIFILTTKGTGLAAIVKQWKPRNIDLLVISLNFNLITPTIVTFKTKNVFIIDSLHIFESAIEKLNLVI